MITDSIYCQACGLKLGERINGVVIVRHYRRLLVDPRAIVCERCETRWDDPSPRPTPTRPAMAAA